MGETGGQLREPEQQQEGRHDRDERHHERHEGQERGEHESRARSGRPPRPAPPRAARRDPRSRCRCPPRARRSRSAARARRRPWRRRARRARPARPSGSRRRRSPGRAWGGRARRWCGRRPRRRPRPRSRRRRRCARPGSARSRRASSRLQVALGPRRVHRLALGSVTTGSSGRRLAAGAAIALLDRTRSSPSPPCSGPRTRARARPRPGRRRRCRRSRATTQARTTVRLWARTQRVSEDESCRRRYGRCARAAKTPAGRIPMSSLGWTRRLPAGAIRGARAGATLAGMASQSATDRPGSRNELLPCRSPSRRSPPRSGCSPWARARAGGGLERARRGGGRARVAAARGLAPCAARRVRRHRRWPAAALRRSPSRAGRRSGRPSPSTCWRSPATGRASARG